MSTLDRRSVFVSTNRLLLVAIICAIGAAAAWADPVTYADPGGTCNGMAPCFTTIQAAVDAANDPDASNSGAFAQVFVFPGTYNEDVDISGINGDSNTGDLSIVTVDAASTPTPGTVTVQTAANPAFFHVAPAFMGRVNIDGFICEITGWDGINLSDIEYDVTISNVVSSFAMAENGLYAFSNMGSISVTNTQASGNMQDGFSGSAETGIALSGCTFNNNGADGASFGTNGTTQITNTSANNNADQGISFSGAGVVTITDCHADNNLNGSGFSFGSSAGVTVAGTTPGGTTANGNESSGFSCGAGGDVSFTNTNASNNTNGIGISCGAAGGVKLTDCNTNDNGDDGVSIGGAATTYDIMGCNANSNGSDGFSFGANGAVTIGDTNANGNDSNGFSFIGATTVGITNSHADNNVNDSGFSFGANGDVTMTDCSANGNTNGIGISFGTSGAVTIDPTSASGNSQGISVLANGQITIDQVTADNNLNDNGMSLTSTAAGVTVTDSSANGNVNGVGMVIGAIGDVVIDPSSASGNSLGISVLATGQITIDQVTADNNLDDNGMSLTSTSAGVTVTNSSANGNVNGVGIVIGASTDVSIDPSSASGNSLGISVLTNGQITIDQVTADNNLSDNGMSLNSTGAGVTVTNSSANGNVNGVGMQISASADVSIDPSTASGNSLGISVLTAGQITIDQVIADNNLDDNGMSLTSTGAGVTVTNSSANGNVNGIGMQIGALGDVLIDPSSASGNNLGVSVLTTGQITNDQLTADNNLDSDGMNLNSAAAGVTVSNSSANGNSNGTGIQIFASTDVTIDPTTASGNQQGVFVSTGGDITLDAVTADNNLSGTGIRVDSISNGVTITNSSADGNTNGAGMEVIAVNAVLIDPSSASGNAIGLIVNTNGQITIDQVTADNNLDGPGMNLTSGVAGISITGSSANGNNEHGIDAVAETNITVDDTHANENGDSGMQLYANVDLNLTGCEANFNDFEGIRAGNYFGTVSNIYITDCSANENGDHGFNVIAFEANEAVLERVTALSNGRLDSDFESDGIFQEAKGYFHSLIVRDSWLSGNANDGLEARSINPASTTHEISGSIICNNGSAGVEIYDQFGLDGVTLNAAGNWWGDITGPTHPNNPGGTGDAVIDADSGGKGAVPFDPWIDTISASASPSNVQVGSPADISFAFSGGGGTVFLGQGPGDLTGDAPFLISTDNGVVTTSTGESNAEAEFVNMPDGVLAFTTTPNTAGPATIVLDGPCGLQTSIMIEAIAADLSITKTDDADPVTVGDLLTYTISVTNDGPGDAMNVVVVDTLPADVTFVSADAGCVEVLGTVTCNLGDLASGASADVLIAVTPTAAGTITNVAQVASDTGDPDVSNNSAVEDTVVEESSTPQTQPTSQPSPDCGAGLCGFGTFGLMPFMLLGLGLTKLRYRRK